MSDLVSCEVCANPFNRTRITHRFCSEKCRHKGKLTRKVEPIEDILGEEWRPVHLELYAAFYQVSNKGRVRSNRGGKADWQLMRPSYPHGYPSVHLRCNNRVVIIKVHRLVLFAFAGRPPEGFEGAHLNGVRDDCRLENLRWASTKENASHRRLHGTQKIGEAHPQAKLSETDVQTIRAIPDASFDAHDVAAAYGVTRHTIWNIRSGRRWKHGV